MKKWILVVNVVSFLAAAFAFWTVYTIPDEVRANVPVLDYTHKGAFSFVTALKPSYVFGPEPPKAALPPSPQSNPKFPIEAVDRFAFKFDYSFSGDPSVTMVVSVVEVTATGSDTKGSPVTIPVYSNPKIAGDFSVYFDFAPAEEISGGNIALNFNVRSAVNANDSLIFESFKQTLVLIREGSVWEVERKNLEYSKPGLLGDLEFKQAGKIQYAVTLKSGSPFGSTTIYPPEVPAPSPAAVPADLVKTVSAGETVFTNLVSKMEGVFSYNFRPGDSVNDFKAKATITAIVENPKVWVKKFVLVDSLSQDETFDLGFPVELANYNSVIEAIKKETGVTPANLNLNIQADVNITANTPYGPLNDTYTQIMPIAIKGSSLVFGEELSKTKPGAVLAGQFVPNPYTVWVLSLSQIKALSVVLAVILMFWYGTFAVFYFRSKEVPVSRSRRELYKTGSRNRDIIADGAMGNGETVYIDSLDDLVKVAHELGKPVVHQLKDSTNEHIYFVIDGITRYVYVFSERVVPSPAKKEAGTAVPT